MSKILFRAAFILAVIYWQMNVMENEQKMPPATPRPAQTSPIPPSPASAQAFPYARVFQNFPTRRFRCKVDIPAYDPADSSKLIGHFIPGTELEVAGMRCEDYMAWVRIPATNGSPEIVALVKPASVDLEKPPPPRCWKPIVSP